MHYWTQVQATWHENIKEGVQVRETGENAPE